MARRYDLPSEAQTACPDPSQPKRVGVIGGQRLRWLQTLASQGSSPPGASLSRRLSAARQTLEWNSHFPLRFQATRWCQPHPRCDRSGRDFVVLSLPSGLASTPCPASWSGGSGWSISRDYRYPFPGATGRRSTSKARRCNSLRVDGALCEEAVYGLPEWEEGEAGSGPSWWAAPGLFPTAGFGCLLLPSCAGVLIET